MLPTRFLTVNYYMVKPFDFMMLAQRVKPAGDDAPRRAARVSLSGDIG